MWSVKSSKILFSKSWKNKHWIQNYKIFGWKYGFWILKTIGVIVLGIINTWRVRSDLYQGQLMSRQPLFSVYPLNSSKKYLYNPFFPSTSIEHQTQQEKQYLDMKLFPYNTHILPSLCILSVLDRVEVRDYSSYTVCPKSS